MLNIIKNAFTSCIVTLLNKNINIIKLFKTHFNLINFEVKGYILFITSIHNYSYIIHISISI